jgi:hypothetical protein
LVTLWTAVTRNPTAEWLARQITEAFPWDSAPKYLIRDNDRAFGGVFKARVRVMGIRLRHGRIYATDCAECETKSGRIDRIERIITLEGGLNAEQRAQLMEIADKCPVHHTLKSEVDIRTMEDPAGA